MRLKWAVLCTAIVQGVSAQTWEIAPFAGYLRLSKKPLGSINATPKDDDTKLKSKQPAYGFRATANTKSYYGVELGYMRSKAGIESSIVPTDTDEDDPAAVLHSGTVAVHQASLNGLCYFMPREERFRPFITAGAQLQFWSNPRLPYWTAGNSRNIGINYGGGLKIRVFKSALVRFDVRQIIAGAPYGLQYAEDESGTSLRSPGRYSQLEGSVGIGFTF